MIQRKQTIFLFAACVLLIVATFGIATVLATAGEGLPVAVLTNFTLGDGKSSNALYSVMGVMLLAAAAICIVAIFLFHNRKMQMRLCWWNIFILLIYYIARMSIIISLAKYLKLKPSFDFYDALPLLAIVMVVLAYRGIRADERLVRDSYRIR